MLCEGKKKARVKGYVGAYAEGYAEGLLEGEMFLLIKQVYRKRQKGLSCKEIADILEENGTTVQKILDAIGASGREFDVERVYALWKNSKTGHDCQRYR